MQCTSWVVVTRMVHGEAIVVWEVAKSKKKLGFGASW